MRGLEGLRVGAPVTRRAAETAELVRKRGGEPVVASVVTEVPEHPSVVLRATVDVISAGPAFCVHLTGVGTRLWFDVADEGGLLPRLLATLDASTIVSRGAKATKALRERDVEPDWIPDGETSTEIAAWLAPRVRAGDAVAVQRYGRPAEVLEDAIVHAGGRVLGVEPYRWALPEDRGPAEGLVREIVAGRIDVLVVTSAPQVQFLAGLAAELDVSDELTGALRHNVYIGAVGEVARAGVQGLGVDVDLVAEPARMGALVRQLAGARDAILAKSRGLVA